MLLAYRCSCFLGLKDATEQGPVDGPRLDSFGVVGGEASGTSLADVQLPAAEIGGGWFHSIWFRFSKDIHNLGTFIQYTLKIFHASDDYIPVANCLNDPLPPLLGEGLLALGRFELQEHRTLGG